MREREEREEREREKEKEREGEGEGEEEGESDLVIEEERQKGSERASLSESDSSVGKANVSSDSLDPYEKYEPTTSLLPTDPSLPLSAKVLDVIRRLWWIISYPPFSLLWLSGMVRYMAGFAIGGWIQIFYRRVHNVSPSDLAVSLAIIIPSAGVTSAYLGGWLADKWERRTTGGKAWLCAVSSFLGSISMAAVLVAPSASLSLGLLWIEYLCAELWYAPAASIALDLNPPHVRSFATAVYLGCGAIGASSSALVGWLNAVIGVTIAEDMDGTEGVSWREGERERETIVCYSLISFVKFLLSHSFSPILPFIPSLSSFLSRSLFLSLLLFPQSIDPVYDPTPALLIVVCGCYAVSALLFIWTAVWMKRYQITTEERLREREKGG